MAITGRCFGPSAINGRAKRAVGLLKSGAAGPFETVLASYSAFRASSAA